MRLDIGDGSDEKGTFASDDADDPAKRQKVWDLVIEGYLGGILYLISLKFQRVELGERNSFGALWATKERRAGELIYDWMCQS